MGPADNSNAALLAGLANQAIVSNTDADRLLLELCLHAGPRRFRGDASRRRPVAQNASVTQLQTQNNALSSVNLNDEAAAMSTLENSYQAASQVFTLLNTMMASALNLGEQTTVA